MYDVKADLVKYSKAVLDGKIPACKAHKQAVKRYLDDLERPNFNYYFDSKSAEKFFKWCTYFKHTKGILAGKTIELSPIQRFIFGNIYGWKHKETHLRRFNKFYWQVGRKNAKSQSLALLGSYEAFAFGELMNEIYIGATKKEQAQIVFNEIVAQLKGMPKLKGKYKHAYGKVTANKSQSVIVPLSKDSGKTGDGLNVGLGIIDEYHAHQTSEIYDVLVSGSGARKQPLMAIITTAGFNLNHPCYTVEYRYVKQILDGVIENHEYFVMVNELDKDDDINDINNLKKANPILASYDNGIKYLLNELKVAKDVPEKMRNFLTKNANVWIDDKEAVLIPLAKWKPNVFQSSGIKLKECYIGIDLSKKIDLTSISFIFPVGDKFYIKNHSFMPNGTMIEKQHTDKVPYRLWMEQGHLSVTDGDIIDYRYIQAYIQKELAKNGWTAKEICFDPWSATQFAMELETEGFTVVEVPQTINRMSEPTKEFRDLVYQGRILHDDNPVLNWAVSNAIAKIDHNENIMLDKAKSTNRIDPLVATVIGFSRARQHSLQDARTAMVNNHFAGSGYSF